ncbi:MFS transporter [Chryseolinea sp. T2]|uniref:MFS transporter n=1 Tax=Chryseolinea sp. T2 TaxID=3129255 RepID=UPI00307844E0
MEKTDPDPLFEQSTPGHIDVPVTHGRDISDLRSRHTKRAVRWGVLSFFFIQGIGFASWASRIPDIKRTLSLSDAGLGSVLFALPAGSIIGLPFAGFLVTRFGSKSVVTIAAILYALTLVVIGFNATTWQLVIGLLVFGTSGNLVNIAINTQAIGVEELYKKSIMASFHGAWSLAGFTGAAIGGALVSANVIPGHHFAGVSLFAILTVVVAQRFLLRAKIAGDDHPIFALPDGPLMRLGVIGFCGMACEGAMFDWSGVYFQTVVLAPAELVTLGYIVFMCAMAAGRFTGDWLVNHIGRKRMIQLSGLLITLGLSISVAFPFLIPATVGFLLVGFGVSSVVPLIYSAAGKSQTLSPGMALAAVSTISFFGFLLGPPVIGFIAEAANLRYSYGLIAVLGLCTALLAGRARL